MKLTNRMKVAGELAVRKMNDVAQDGYYGTDPLELYEYEDEEELRYAIKTERVIDGLTFEEAEAYLGSFVFDNEE